MTAPYLVAAPTSQPLNRTDVKQHSNIDHAQDDTLIDSYIQAATSYLDGRDGILGRALITQTWARTLSCFPDRIRLPLGPVASITSIKYYDPDDVEQTLASSVYELRRDDVGAYAQLAWNQQWPNYTPRPDGITVTWVAGSSASALPRALRHAMLMLIGHWYENREAVVIGVTAMDVPVAFNHLIAPFRRIEPYNFESEERMYSPWY